jgi:hypothetical protein
MGKGRVVCRLALSLAAVAVACMTCGCMQYWKYRYEDAGELGGIGITVSKTPQFAAYADGVSVAPGGYAKLDCTFLGYGGGRFGATRHYTHDVGLVGWGYEEFGWGDDFDVEVPGTLTSRQHVGVLGVIAGGTRRPAYMPACIHYIHLGYVGFVGNLRYLEMLDFMLGFAAIDIAGDDGTEFSSWPWRRGAILTDFSPEPGEPFTKCAACGGFRNVPEDIDGPGGKSPFTSMKGEGEEPVKPKPPTPCKCPPSEG